ncbi:alpha/beta hydrolase [Candidatus Parcubacteria bacterium]|nr:alpha/beta hydrolase [Candidatus Parcubacteria bacterium]
MKQVVINDILIAYDALRHPAPQPETFVLLHGWRSRKEVWRVVAEQLFSHGDVYALDLPGFGNSEIPGRALTVSDYADLVADFIQKCELKAPTVIGHSFGGRVTIALASIHPESIGKIVLVDSAGFINASAKRRIAKAAARLLRPLFRPTFMASLRQKIYELIGAEDYVATPWLRQTFTNIINEDLSEHLRAITAPTLLLWGKDDRETPLSFATRMRALIARSRLVVLEGAGHFSFADQPKAFVEAVQTFLRETP